MEIEAVKTELLATLHLVEKSLARTLQTLLLGVSEIDQVAIVRQDVAGVDSRGGKLTTKRLDRRCGEGCRTPLALVFGEERKGRCTYG